MVYMLKGKIEKFEFELELKKAQAGIESPSHAQVRLWFVGWWARRHLHFCPFPKKIIPWFQRELDSSLISPIWAIRNLNILQIKKRLYVFVNTINRPGFWTFVCWPLNWIRCCLSCWLWEVNESHDDEKSICWGLISRAFIWWPIKLKEWHIRRIMNSGWRFPHLQTVPPQRSVCASSSMGRSITH